MAKMVQIRNMPDALHRKLKKQAQEAGLSLSEYLLQMARKSVEPPSMKEFLRRVDKLEPIDLEGISIADIIREGRERRGY